MSLCTERFCTPHTATVQSSDPVTNTLETDIAPTRTDVDATKEEEELELEFREEEWLAPEGLVEEVFDNELCAMQVTVP